MSETPMLTRSQPMYARLVDTLLAEIRLQYAPGELLPTQRELSERFGTSVITVKRALDEIGRMGVVESVRGKGTIVRRPTVVDAHTGVSSWTESMIDMGVRPHTAWNRLDIEEGAPETRRLLKLKHGERMVVVRRLRTIDDDPICLMWNYLPALLVPGLAEQGLSDESLYAVLRERYGIAAAYADEEVLARSADQKERETFGPECRIVVQVDRLSYDSDHRPIEIARLVAPSDRYTYRVRVSSKPATGQNRLPSTGA